MNICIFVFGSNTQGRHGKGAAKDAVDKWGAIYGQPEGLQGNAYAIVTKELRPGYPPVKLSDVRRGVDKFIAFARTKPGWRFYVTPIGCGLAGFKPEQIAPLFGVCPDNIFLPKEFKAVNV